MSNLIECPMCKTMISPNAVACPKCGEPKSINDLTKLPEQDVIQDAIVEKEEINQNTKSVKKLKSKWYVISILLIIIVSLVGASVYYLSPTERAKSVSNKYLTAMKKGEDTTEYKNYLVDDFINVLDFKYLGVDEIVEYKEYIDYINASYYNENIKNKYDFKSYTEWRNHETKDFKGYEIVSENIFGLILWDNKSYYSVVTLKYDVEITNGLGQKIYEKVSIECTENFDGKYEITDIFY